MKSIIVSSRFRTGSTLLFQLLSQDQRYHCYNEVLHPHIPIWMEADIEKHREMNQILAHDNVRYFSEYENLDRQIFSELHSIDFTINDLVMTSESHSEQLERYLRYLLYDSTDKPVILNCNRVDYRLSWIKKKFPDVIIINLRRHITGIVNSYGKVLKRAGLDSFKHLFETHLYLENIQKWSHINLEDLNEQEVLYFLKLLSDEIADEYADYTFAFEDICQHPNLFKEEIRSKINVNISELSQVRPMNDRLPFIKYIRMDFVSSLVEQVLSAYKTDQDLGENK